MIECDHKVAKIDHEGRDKIGTCVVCGRRWLYPEDDSGPPTIIAAGTPSNRLNLHQRHRYFEVHKDDIIADYHAAPEGQQDKAVIEKWHISASGWTGLKRAWGLPAGMRLGRRTARPGRSEEPKEKPQAEAEQVVEAKAEKMRRQHRHATRVDLGEQIGKKIEDLSRYYCVTPGTLVRIAVIQFLDRGGQIV